MKKQPYRWLDRRIAKPGPYLALCLSEDEFCHALRHLKTTDRPEWVSPGAHATAHVFSGARGTTCIVCLSDYLGRSPIEVAGLLVHEAVHIWQSYCEDMGERSPAIEQEAYAIQSISQELMAEFARRME